MKCSTYKTEPQTACKPPPSFPLDEARWTAWVEKGKADEKRMRAGFLKGLKGLSMMTLVVAAFFWSNLLPYDGVGRFALSAGALAATLLFLRGRKYAMAAVAGSFALLFNPVAPALSLGGDWPRTLMVATALLLVASFAGFEKRKQND